MAKGPPKLPHEQVKSNKSQAKANWVILAALVVVVLPFAAGFFEDTSTDQPASKGPARQSSKAQVTGSNQATESNFTPFNVMGAELFTSFMVTCPENLTGDRGRFVGPVEMLQLGRFE
jgi:hypothetical protein